MSAKYTCRRWSEAPVERTIPGAVNDGQRPLSRNAEHGIHVVKSTSRCNGLRFVSKHICHRHRA